jgi:predicted amino acid dehydrogenase
MSSGDRLAAAMLNVETLDATDQLSSESVAELADIVADVQAMVADATRTVEAAARALANAQAKLTIVLESASGAVIPANGHVALPDATHLHPFQIVAHAGTGQD